MSPSCHTFNYPACGQSSWELHTHFQAFKLFSPAFLVQRGELLTWIRKAAISSLLSLHNENGTCASKQTSQAKLNVVENAYFRNTSRLTTAVLWLCSSFLCSNSAVSGTELCEKTFVFHPNCTEGLDAVFFRSYLNTSYLDQEEVTESFLV